MKQYVCVKKAIFGDEQYYAGNVVPDEKIDPNRVKQLIDYGILSIVDVPEPTKESLEPENRLENANDTNGQSEQNKQNEQDSEKPDKQDESADKPDAEKPAGKKVKK